MFQALFTEKGELNSEFNKKLSIRRASLVEQGIDDDNPWLLASTDSDKNLSDGFRRSNSDSQDFLDKKTALETLLSRTPQKAAEQRATAGTATGEG